MKRWRLLFVGVLAGIVAALATVLVGVSTSSFAVTTNVNNFTISNFQVEMHLGVDDEGRSTLKTTETITAEFPDFDQNHGLERAIPLQYDGHTTSVEIISVTDDTGAERVYSTYSDDNGNLIVRMADMDTYVHGTQTYVLTYSQYDVTKYIAGSDRDEFYWDINGVDWRVPIERLSTRIILEDDLVDAQTGQLACYEGYAGSAQQCVVTQNGAAIESDVLGLGASQNVTMAIGFGAHTFVPYQPTIWEQIVAWWVKAQLVTLPVAVGVIIWLAVLYRRTSERRHELKPIPAEYLPPENASVTTAARVLHIAKGSVMTAQLLDLAVRHYVRLYEVTPRKWYRAGEYEIEITQAIDDLRDEEAELLTDMFGWKPVVGDTFNLKKLRNNTSYYRRTLNNDPELDALIKGEYGFRRADNDARARFRRIAKNVFIIAIVAFLSVPLAAVALLALLMSITLFPLTDKGVKLARYVNGLKAYIGAAEQERLQMLQSADGAEKVVAVTNGTDEKSLVKLYERVLPYAVLFGHEKTWTKQLGRYYEQANTQPDWYVGQTAFNAAVFTSVVSGINQASTYARSSSSSSGGASGGGFSGGGGGGGGGGGV